MEDNDKIQFYLSNDFERELCKASYANLSDKSNKLRFNNFAYSLRELITHVLKRLSPDDEVLKSQWYKNEMPNKKNGITRGQRIKYAVQGGILDKYITDLGIDVAKLNANWKVTINRLNNYTHINPGSFNLPDKKVNKLSKSASDCFVALFIQIEDSRTLILEKLREHLMAKIFEGFLEEYNKMVEVPSGWIPLPFNDKNTTIQSIGSAAIKVKSFGTANTAKSIDSGKRLSIDMVDYLFEFSVSTEDLLNPKVTIDDIILNNGSDEIPDKLLDAMIDNEIEENDRFQ